MRAHDIVENLSWAALERAVMAHTKAKFADIRAAKRLKKWLNLPTLQK
jgi:hypothetical protein